MPPPTGITPAPKFFPKIAAEIAAECEANPSRDYLDALGEKMVANPPPREPIPCGLHAGGPIPKTVGAENKIGNAGRSYWVCSGGCFLGWGDRDEKNGALVNTFKEKRMYGGAVREEWINNWQSTNACEEEMTDAMFENMKEEILGLQR